MLRSLREHVFIYIFCNITGFIMYKVRATVVDMTGKCHYHKVGDYVEIENDLLTLPAGKKVCTWSLSAMLPYLAAIQRKHDEKSDWLSDAGSVMCSDKDVGVIWKIEKIPV